MVVGCLRGSSEALFGAVHVVLDAHGWGRGVAKAAGQDEGSLRRWDMGVRGRWVVGTVAGGVIERSEEVGLGAAILGKR